MPTKIVWIFAFVSLYWGYCIYWGLTSSRAVKTASDFFIAGRRLSPWVFVLAVSAASFASWTFIEQPGLIYRDGFQYGYAAFAAIAIPFAGVMFFKRLWMLGKRFGYVTPGEMFADYFDSEFMRVLVIVVTLLFSIPFLGVQLRASGYLVELLTGGAVEQYLGLWVLAGVVVIYVSLGGLRAVAYVGTLQFLLLAGGLVAIGVIAYGELGGFGAFTAALSRLGATALGNWGATSQGYNPYLAVPGVIEFTAGLGKQTPAGGPWTGAMILTYMFAFMGLQASPNFIMWAFGSRDPTPFGPQQVWASAAVIGFILVTFTAAAGMGANFLGASPAINEAGLAISAVLPDLSRRRFDLVPGYINLLGESAPWFVGLLAVCAIAAMQAIVATLSSTASGIFTRDFYKHYLDPAADDQRQVLYGRIAVGLIILAASLVATYSPVALVELGGVALAFGFQMWPALAAACWLPWFTRQGVIVGLVAGMAAVVFTDTFGQSAAAFVGIDLPWGRWPWTMHSAAWGMAVNLAVCVIVSAATQDQADRQRRMRYHGFLAENAALSPQKRRLRPTAWGLTLVWMFFAIGPGAVIGNDLFGPPNGGIEAWSLRVPSIWAWQIVWLGLGILMMWLLAYRMEMSTPPAGKVEALVEDIAITIDQADGVKETIDRLKWFWIAVIGIAVVILVGWVLG